MKASKSEQEKLLALQALDSSLDQLAHKLRNLTVSKTLEEKTSEFAARSEEHTSELQSPCKSRMPSSA